MSNRIFILAGTYDQYKQLANQLYAAMAAEGMVLRRQDLIYVTPDSIRGFRDIWGYTVGTWQHREDLPTLREMIRWAGSSVENDFIEVEL